MSSVMRRTRMNRELFDPQATFTPCLNQRSIRLAQARKLRAATASLPGELRSRSMGLARPHGNAAHPRHRSLSPSPERRRPTKLLEPSDAKECTFKPAVNEHTDDYLARAGIPSDFRARQDYYEQRRQVSAFNRLRSLRCRGSGTPLWDLLARGFLGCHVYWTGGTDACAGSSNAWRMQLQSGLASIWTHHCTWTICPQVFMNANGLLPVAEWSVKGVCLAVGVPVPTARYQACLRRIDITEQNPDIF
jgi:hypothetical protein